MPAYQIDSSPPSRDNDGDGTGSIKEGPALNDNRPALKLVVIIVSDDDADLLVREMVKRGMPATRLGSTGGFLKRGNTTILSGVESPEVEDLLAIVRRTCSSRLEELTPLLTPPADPAFPYLPPAPKMRVGGAVVFVLPVDRMEKT